MTAKRRYIPRIVEGNSRIESLLSNPTEDNLDDFLTNEVPSLKRAMLLFGASLRRGETPDDTSRKAEALTESFVKSTESLKKSSAEKRKVQFEVMKTAFTEYLQFTKIDVSSGKQSVPES